MRGLVFLWRDSAIVLLDSTMKRAVAEAIAAQNREVGRLVDSSQADDRMMINLVRARRLLYARTNMPVASYYKQVKLLWQEVADRMHWSVADVRRKWSHIRNSYSRHLRNELNGARTGRGRAVSRWYLADDLEFLREHMATDTRPSPFTRSYSPPYQEGGSLEGAPNDFSHWFAPSSNELTPTPAPAPHPSHAHEEDSTSSFTIDENTSYFQFFRGIYADYQELSANKQRQFRRQALVFLHELLDEEELDRSGGLGGVAVSGEPPVTSPDPGSEEELDQKPDLARLTQIVDSSGRVVNCVPATPPPPL